MPPTSLLRLGRSTSKAGQWIADSRGSAGPTIDVRRVLKVDSQYSIRGKCKYKYIVRYLSSHEIRSNVEVELHSFDVKDWQGCIGGGIGGV